MQRSADFSVTVVIPTFEREQVLVDTVRALLACKPNPAEMIVVDQTLHHEVQTDEFLQTLCESGQLRWLRLNRPSIPRAMNIGLRAARSAIVLFVPDDDIQPSGDLVAAHAAAHLVKLPGKSGPWPARFCNLVSRVPHVGHGLPGTDSWPIWIFRSGPRTSVRSLPMSWPAICRSNGTRHCRPERFDENFEGVAYRFETEFARRVVSRGGRILLLEPAASLESGILRASARRHARAGQPFDVCIARLWHGRLLLCHAIGLEFRSSRIYDTAARYGKWRRGFMCVIPGIFPSN